MLVSKQAPATILWVGSFYKFNNNLKYVRVEHYYREKLSRLYKFAYVFFKKD